MVPTIGAVTLAHGRNEPTTATAPAPSTIHGCNGRWGAGPSGEAVAGGWSDDEGSPLDGGTGGVEGSTVTVSLDSAAVTTCLRNVSRQTVNNVKGPQNGRMADAYHADRPDHRRPTPQQKAGLAP
jgi:hypothetical protein